jgi:hypothetical protein
LSLQGNHARIVRLKHAISTTSVWSIGTAGSVDARTLDFGTSTARSSARVRRIIASSGSDQRSYSATSILLTPERRTSCGRSSICGISTAPTSRVETPASRTPVSEAVSAFATCRVLDKV